MSERHVIFPALALIALAGSLLFIDLHLPLGVSTAITYVAVVLLASWITHRTLIFYFAALCSVLAIAGFFWSPPGGVLWMAITNRSLAILAIWTIALLTWRRRQDEERLRQVNRELDAFVHTVSHDLRSPLTPILGFADFLRQEYSHCLTEQGKLAVDEIEQQGERMLALLEDLLQLARAGHLERPANPVDVEAVVQGVLGSLGEPLAQTGSEVHCGPLPATRIPETLLAQLFDNLVGNALRYAGGGLIEIGGERRGEKVIFFVRDHGSGIPRGEREKIFEAFCRGSSARALPGTGIGLATVRRIAVHFGGRAWVEETPGGGSTFRIELTG